MQSETAATQATRSSGQAGVLIGVGMLLVGALLAAVGLLA